MDAKQTLKKEGSFFLRLHPLQRVVLSILFAAVVLFLLRNSREDGLFIGIAAWSAFAFSYLVIAWVIISSRKVRQIKEIAKKEDGSRFFVMIFIIITAFAAVISVLILVISSGKSLRDEYITVPVSFFSMLVSWALVHTLLTFHYANLYYSCDAQEPLQPKGGIEFPGTEPPDYMDFAYFSFVIGMTFQVSDVVITDKKVRRLVLMHGLISFVLNTFVVALTVNFIAGLKK